MLLVWDENAWADYLWWQAQDWRVLQRINTLIEDVARNRNEGVGKPEALRHDFAGYWSRRITDEHRLAYKLVDTEIRIAASRYHYGRRFWTHPQRPRVRPGSTNQSPAVPRGNVERQGRPHDPVENLRTLRELCHTGTTPRR